MVVDDESHQQGNQKINKRQVDDVDLLQIAGIALGLDNVIGSLNKEKIEEQQDGDHLLAGFDVNHTGKEDVQAVIRHQKILSKRDGPSRSQKKLFSAASSSSKMSRTLVNIVTWKMRKSFLEILMSFSLPPRL